MANQDDFNKKYDALDAEPKKTLRLFLEGKKNKEIADELQVEESVIRKRIPKLCDHFLGKVSKKDWQELNPSERRTLNYERRQNLINLCRNYGPDPVSPQLVDDYDLEPSKIPDNFDIYLEPEKLPDCYNKIVEPGALIRIKAPQKMGKTLLLNKILDRADKEGYDLAVVNFWETDVEVLSDYQKLLRWFCVYLGDELELEDKVEEQFKDVFGNNKNCTNYLERYLLKERDRPLVLVLEGVDAVFEVADFNTDFCRMLREWNNAAKLPTRRGKIWQQVRLIIVHSTEVYGGLDINSSPLAGVGLTVALSGFNLEQVKQLAGSCGLGLSDREVLQLTEAFGGHPYLVKNALVILKKGEFNLTELLEVAPTEASPFGNHLRKLLDGLKRQPELEKAYLEVVNSDEPVQLETNLTFKLESLGLVKVEKDFCLPYCELYRQYFSSRLNN